MRGGSYYFLDGHTVNQSRNGYYWSWQLNNSWNGYDIGFSFDYIDLSGSNFRGFGLALRCLVLAGKATKSKTIAAIVGSLRADAAGVEGHEVAIGGIIQKSQPVVAVARLIVQRTIVVVVVASAH